MIKVQLENRDLTIARIAVEKYLVEVSLILGDQNPKVIEIAEVLSLLESGN